MTKHLKWCTYIKNKMVVHRSKLLVTGMCIVQTCGPSNYSYDRQT